MVSGHVTSLRREGKDTTTRSVQVALAYQHFHRDRKVRKKRGWGDPTLMLQDWVSEVEPNPNLELAVNVSACTRKLQGFQTVLN